MTLEYVKHDRPLTTHQINHFGKLATHDIEVPCLLLYEMGKIRDKNGIEVDIDRDFINNTLKKTNDWIKKRHLLPFAKFISQWAKPVEEANAIPFIKNHKTDQVEEKVGDSKGLLYTEEVNGILSLFTKVVITKPEAKQDVVGGLLRPISIGTRHDGSIKEISFVVNEAAPLCGLMFSEPNFKQENGEVKFAEPAIIQDDRSLELAEEISNLQFAENQLEHVIIPNHYILSRMIKNGKLMPYKYDELIKSMNPSVLELMEQSIPSKKLGLMFGTQKKPEKMQGEEFQFSEQLKKSQQKLNISSESSEIEMIKNHISPEEIRTKELEYILELAEHSPNIVSKYIRCELGEEVEDPMYKDTLLSEYLGELKQIKSKIIQLGEQLNVN